MSLTHNYFDREQDKPSGHSAPKHGQKIAPHRPSRRVVGIWPQVIGAWKYIYYLLVKSTACSLIHFDYSISKSLSFAVEKANIRWFVSPLNKLTWPHFPSDLLTQNDKIQRICQSMQVGLCAKGRGRTDSEPFSSKPTFKFKEHTDFLKSSMQTSSINACSYLKPSA